MAALLLCNPGVIPIGGTSVGHYVLACLVPTLIGNTVGGVSLVAALTHRSWLEM